MGIFSSLFGPSEVTTTNKPQVLEGIEPLVPDLTKLAQRAYQRPYAQRDFARISPFTRDQNAGFAGVRGTATDPRYGRQQQQAEDTLGEAGDDRNLSGIIGKLGRRVNAASWSPTAMKAYMNPFQEGVIDNYMKREDERTGMRRADLARKQAGKKAFGSGADLGAEQFERDEEDRKSDALQKMLQSGYDTSAGLFGKDADRALSAEGLTTTGTGQAATAENSRLTGKRATANDLSGLADRWRTGNMENSKALLNIGQQQQNQSQKGMDLQEKDFEEQRDFPATQAEGLSRIIYGAPRGSTTTSPGPSLGGQILGAGLGAVGLYNGIGWKRGGPVRLAAGGSEDGISNDDLLAMLNDPETDDTTKESIRERLRMSDQGPAGIGYGAAGAPSGDAGPMAPGMILGRDDASGRDDTALPPNPLPPQPSASEMGPEGGADAGTGTGADRYQMLLDKLIGSYNPERDKWLALASVGAHMAASKSPNFLGAVGEGAAGGLKTLQNLRAEGDRTLSRAASVEQQRQSGIERTQDRKTQMENAKQAALDRADDRRERLTLDQRRAEELNNWRTVQEEKGRWQYIGPTKDGTGALMMDTKSAHGGAPMVKTVPLEAGIGSKTGGGKPSVYDQRKMDWLAIHPDDHEGAIKFGKGEAQLSADKALSRATQVAKAEAAQELRPAESAAIYKRVKDETLTRLGFDPQTLKPIKFAPDGGGAASAPAPGAPSPKAALPAGMTKEQVIAGAKTAIAQGKDKGGVAAKLKAMGIDPKALD